MSMVTRSISTRGEEIPDGGSVRVELPFMDSMAARVARVFGDGESTSESLLRQGYVLDGLGRLAGHRPGHAYGFVPPQQQGLIEDSRERWLDRTREGWRNPRPAPASVADA
jgi:hypothetical protein